MPKARAFRDRQRTDLQPLLSMRTFGDYLKEARKRCSLSQDDLAKKLNVPRGEISAWENNKGAPAPDRATQAAEILGEDTREFLLLAILQDANSTNALRPELERAVADLRALMTPATRLNSIGTSTHLTLCDFPQGFHEPFKIVVGDKRENPPKSVGDLAAFSASTVDDRWLPMLGLPKNGTEKIFDKIFAMAPDEVLKKKFGKATIISIASPASNLFSRFYNENFLFRFSPIPQIKKEWNQMRNLLEGFNKTDCPPSELERFSFEHAARFKHLMRQSKRPAFIDYNYEFLEVGFIGADNLDFAVVSIGLNPFSEPENPRFAILVAGAQHPGTALALRQLADQTLFKNHPFGGVLEVDVPDRKIAPKNIPWWDKVENSSARWHSVGTTDLGYTPETLTKRLEDWASRLKSGGVIQQISPEEVLGHIKLIEALRQARLKHD